MSSKKKRLTEKKLVKIANNWAFCNYEVDAFSDMDSQEIQSMFCILGMAKVQYEIRG